MEPSALHKHTAVYTEQDNCLYFALGLAKAAADFRRLAETSPEHSDDPDDPPADGTGDDFELFLLGLLSFSRRYGGVIDALRAQALPQAEPLTRSDPPVIRELLR